MIIQNKEARNHCGTNHTS